MSCDDCISRRRFLSLGVQAAQGAAAIALLSGPFSLLQACSATTTPLGVVIEPGPQGDFTINFSDQPQLQNIGGAYAVSLASSVGSVPVSIVRTGVGTATTVNATCTHQGCLVGAYNSTSQSYLCPCHQSIFTVNGSVVRGPATTPLTNYTTVVNATSVVITLF